jgi:hypothetical protein
MAQTQTWTNEGITELVKLATGGTATAFKSVVCLTDSTPCTAAVTSPYASPADTKVTDSGFALANADSVTASTTNTTGDTIEVDHVFTGSGSKNLTGVLVCNDDDDVAFIECCFNAVIAAESSDTLTVEVKGVLDQAA